MLQEPTREEVRPPLDGMREHLERVRIFGNISYKIPDAAIKYRMMLAAIYSCRAFVELLLEFAGTHGVQSITDKARLLSRKDAEVEIAERIPFYHLTEKIRIHDFHRFGIRPPVLGAHQIHLQGPITLRAGAGETAVCIGNGIQQVSGNPDEVKLRRPLLIVNGEFFDDGENRFVRLDEILNGFLATAPSLIKAYE